MAAAQKIAGTALQNALASVPGWTVSEEGAWLLRDYQFKNFSQALAFVNAVGDLAEQHKHHPDVTLGWGYCNLALQTHDAGGLTEKDFRLAAAINNIKV